MKFFVSSPKGRWALVAKEAKMHGYKPFDSFDSWTYVEGELDVAYRLNLRSRVANKIYIEATKRTCLEFDHLFDLVDSVNWSDYVTAEQGVHVDAKVKSSVLSSTPTIQKITLKAIMKQLAIKAGTDKRPVNKDTPPLNVVIYIENNKTKVLINTSWHALHERGYRDKTGKAPIKENVAAALILQSGWNFSDPLWDPFCGSGTFAIEAAFIARNIAPGLDRGFAFELFPIYEADAFETTRQEALSKQYNKHYTIIATDIDPKMTAIAKQNAQNAEVDDTVTFITKDFLDGKVPYALDGKAIHMVTNPPYGKRINQDQAKEISDLLGHMGEKWKYTGWFITLMPPLKRNKSLWKTKPVFNGPDLCTFYQVKK